MSFQAFDTTRRLWFHGNEPGTLFKHICPPTFGGGPLDDIRNFPSPVGIPDAQIRKIARNLMVRIDLILPPGHPVINMIGDNRLPMWIIENPDAADTPTNPKRAYPSPLIRTVQGDYVHAAVGFKKNTHTIHWHGIEPSTMNDGVGKHSFEGNGNFVYQFQTNEAGTYFYHCHKNTTLHFEMGLFGLFIVDPPNPGGDGVPFTGLVPPYATGGPGYVAGQRSAVGLSGGDAIPYHQEKIWVYDDMDSMWHYPEPHHNHAMQDCDANDPVDPATFYEFGTEHFDLNVFNPDIFAVSGVVMNPLAGPNPWIGRIEDPNIAVNAVVGERVLIRYLNAGYTITEVILPVPGVIIAWDGHPLGLDGIHQYSSAYVVPKEQPIRISTARRFDMILDTSAPTAPGAEAEIHVYDWVKGINGQLADVHIPITITGS